MKKGRILSALLSIFMMLVSKFTGSRLGLLSVDEVTIDHQGQMQFLRRHNGDQSHQGRHARINVGEWKILHIQLYEYK